MNGARFLEPVNFVSFFLLYTSHRFLLRRNIYFPPPLLIQYLISKSSTTTSKIEFHVQLFGIIHRRFTFEQIYRNEILEMNKIFSILRLPLEISRSDNVQGVTRRIPKGGGGQTVAPDLVNEEIPRGIRVRPWNWAVDTWPSPSYLRASWNGPGSRLDDEPPENRADKDPEAKIFWQVSRIGRELAIFLTLTSRSLVPIEWLRERKREREVEGRGRFLEQEESRFHGVRAEIMDAKTGRGGGRAKKKMLATAVSSWRW